MRLSKLLAFAGVLGLIILLDPIPSTAQFKGGKGGGFGQPGSSGGDRPRFGGPGSGPPGGPGSTFPGAPGGGDRPRFGGPGGGAPMGPGSMPGGPGGGSRFDRGSGGPPMGPGGGPPMGPGGGPSGGGRGQMDPDQAFNMLVNVSGGRDTIRFDNIPPDTKVALRGMSERMGTRPLPDSGEWSKGQFMDYYNANQAVIQQRSSGGSSSGGDSMQKAEEYARDRIKKQDRDGDGRISFEEADDRLKPNFEAIDLNRDRHIDVEEYKMYMLNRLGGGSSGGPSGPGGSYIDTGRDRRDDDKKKEELKVVAIRYGTLPKEAPSFFTDLDTDKDAQVALYEWRNSGNDLREFTAMDLNNDGLVTFDEYVRYRRFEDEREKITAKEEGIDGGGVGASSGGNGRPSSSYSGRGSSGYSRPGSDSKSGSSDSNPFRSGGKSKPGK